VIWRATHSADGCGVTLIQTSSLRSSRTMMQAYNRSKPRFGTTNRSMAAMSGARLCKKVRHPWLGGPRRLTMYLATPEMRDLKPELEQFAVNAWRAPKRIFDAHPPDQHAQLHIDPRSPSPST